MTTIPQRLRRFVGFADKMLWSARVGIARLVIGRNSCVMNVDIKDGILVLDRGRKNAMCGVNFEGKGITFVNKAKQ